MNARQQADQSDDYPDETAAPVRYFAVSLRGEVVGYLWASEDDLAADFIRKLDAQDRDTFEAYMRWRRRLRAAKANGVPPLKMLRQWRGKPEDPVVGGIPADADELRAESLRSLEEIANPNYFEPTTTYSEVHPVDRSENWEDLAPFTTLQTEYAFTSDSAVHYFPIHRNGPLIGYLWASNSEFAAAYIQRSGSGAVGFQAGRLWRERLKRAYQAGTPPLDAIRHWVGAPMDPVGGGIPANAAEREALNSEVMERIAAGTAPEGEQP